jgi:5-methylcytosine-specific restriction enzyme subunit McrC
MRFYYYKALEIALLVLAGRGVSLQNYGSDVVLGSFIINFEELFEAYVRNVLQSQCGSAFWVQDGNREAKKPLFDDCKEPPAQPDIVIIERASGQKTIAEVKYKDRPNRDDINQALTYALSYRTKKSVLIHQRRPSAKQGLQKIGLVNGIHLNSYAFDLAVTDIEREEREMAACLFDLAKA